MSPAFDGGVGGRYTNRSHPTPVVPRATFPTTFERDGTHLPAVHQESRPDATASAIIDRRLTLSQTTSTGSRGRGEIAFYRSQQHQPANVGSSVMLDTIEHQPHQTLQASPRGSPQALPIRSLAQVGPSGGLPSVRQVSIRQWWFFLGSVNKSTLVNCLHLLLAARTSGGTGRSGDSLYLCSRQLKEIPR